MKFISNFKSFKESLENCKCDDCQCNCQECNCDNCQCKNCNNKNEPKMKCNLCDEYFNELDSNGSCDDCNFLVNSDED